MRFELIDERAHEVMLLASEDDMTSEATCNLEFELLDLDSLHSHVSLASKFHNLQNDGTVVLTKVEHHSDSITRIVAEWTVDE